MGLYRSCLRPLLFRLDAERAHNLGVWSARWLAAPTRTLVRAVHGVRDARLRQTLWGLEFATPVGLAAGLDKNGVAIDGFAAFGFSHVEIGTITGQAQPGNDRPRLFRLPTDLAVINRMGFNNLGADAVAVRLARRYARRRPGCVLGINLGKSKVVGLDKALDDYAHAVSRLGPVADYVVVNVSSPNTPGLRDLQGETMLRPLLAGVRAALDAACPPAGGRRRPLLLKIAPDLSDDGVDAAVDVALETGCDGLIATNTTITRGGLKTPSEVVCDIGAGGLSGQPVRLRSTAVLARVARRLARQGGGNLPVIGVGGIDSAEAAWEKISHGASLVQLYTALVYEGPGLVRRIAHGLLERLEREGLSHISQAVGRAL